MIEGFQSGSKEGTGGRFEGKEFGGVTGPEYLSNSLVKISTNGYKRLFTFEFCSNEIEESFGEGRIKSKERVFEIYELFMKEVEVADELV